MGIRRGWIGAAFDGRVCTALLVAVACLACGGDESRTERVAAMVATPTDEGKETVGDQPPVIESLELEPNRPVVGKSIRVKARFAASKGPRPDVTYQWQNSSGRELGRGPELDTRGLDPGAVIEVLATPVAGKLTGEVFVHRIRLADEASQVALVVIDTREGKSVGSILRAVVETTNESDGFDAVALEWRVAGKRVGDEDALDTAPFAPGDEVELRAFLGNDSESRLAIRAEPIVLEQSAPPEITSAPGSGIEGGLFRYAIAAKSPVPSAALHFELLKGPDGMTVDAATGVVQWRPAASQRGRFDVEVAVKDQWGSGIAQDFSISADSRLAPPAAAQ